MQTKNNKKIFKIFAIYFVFISLVIILKIINQKFLGNNDWKQVFILSVENDKINENWFSNGKITVDLFLGPIGLKSVVHFKLLYENYRFLLPVLWDLVINWIFIVVTLWFITSLFIKLLTIIKSKKNLHNLVETNETVTQIKENQVNLKHKQNIDNISENKSFEKVELVDSKVVIDPKENNRFKKTKKKYPQVKRKDIEHKIKLIYPDLTKSNIKLIVQSTFDIISNQINKNQTININNFGVFFKYMKAAKVLNNPLTGEQIFVPETNVIKFKPSRVIKYAMNVKAVKKAISEKNKSLINTNQVKIVNKSNLKVDDIQKVLNNIEKQNKKELQNRKENLEKLTVSQKSTVDGSKQIKISRSELETNAIKLKDLNDKKYDQKAFKEKLKNMTKKEILLLIEVLEKKIKAI
ncbi:hypothetical protein MENTO_v1c05490 [Mesoplasma entomophilum]|uniref:HU family DNA-binding protein n=1 Tax=Mesoplasma entomophilum TaxID=2149 RepID=A0A3S5XZI0_9MOLU|nr:HU family DNA-binding protein [Mesoplasma entomophilum]ATQ35684.1 hypothetical protein CS528_02840 [Mesoplasma entomophilum]ATZ19651.1 hypothetical protein MENTO_v1c05490 [Mesoplasma entomophilum]